MDTITIIVVVIFGAAFVVAMKAMYDAPYMPIQKPAIKAILKRLKPTAKSRFIDLGAGDNRVAITAAKKYNVMATGLELSPPFFVYGWLLTVFSGSGAGMKFGDMFRTRLSTYDYIFIFQLPHTTNKLAEKFHQEAKPGAIIISHAFPLPHWEPTLVISATEANAKYKTFVYTKE